MKRRYIAIVCAIVTIVILYAGYVSVKNATVRLENNLGIVPENYPDFHLSADFEECMETFRFVELKED